jgi:hypothetical protein
MFAAKISAGVINSQRNRESARQIKALDDFAPPRAG